MNYTETGGTTTLSYLSTSIWVLMIVVSTIFINIEFIIRKKVCCREPLILPPKTTYV